MKYSYYTSYYNWADIFYFAIKSFQKVLHLDFKILNARSTFTQLDDFIELPFPTEID